MTPIAAQTVMVNIKPLYLTLKAKVAKDWLTDRETTKRRFSERRSALFKTVISKKSKKYVVHLDLKVGVSESTENVTSISTGSRLKP